jgi:hypothetical protein
MLYSASLIVITIINYMLYCFTKQVKQSKKPGYMSG